MNLRHEPIRLPAWIASLLAVAVLPALAAWLTGTDWRTVLVAAIGAVIPLLAVAEGARAFVTSPANRAPGETAPPAKHASYPAGREPWRDLPDLSAVPPTLGAPPDEALPDSPDMTGAESLADIDHTVPTDLLELHEVLEWEAAQ